MTKYPTPVKAIRKKCIDCSGGSLKEVRLCQVTECELYPFRMGRNPNYKGKVSDDSESSKNS